MGLVCAIHPLLFIFRRPTKPSNFESSRYGTVARYSVHKSNDALQFPLLRCTGWNGPSWNYKKPTGKAIPEQLCRTTLGSLRRRTAPPSERAVGRSENLRTRNTSDYTVDSRQQHASGHVGVSWAERFEKLVGALAGRPERSFSFVFGLLDSVGLVESMRAARAVGIGSQALRS